MKFSVLCVTETWLSSEIVDRDIELEGYQVYRKDRNRHGGGVMMYVSDSLYTTRRGDLENDEIESIWCDVTKANTNLLINCSYRPPSADDTFFDLFEIQIQKATDQAHAVKVILGDFNVKNSNWLNSSTTDNPGRQLDNIFMNHGLEQVLHEPTRGRNLFDLIVTSHPVMCHQTGTLAPLGDSDHLARATALNLKANHHSGKRLFWLYSKANIETLHQHIAAAPWDINHVFDSMDDIWDSWNDPTPTFHPTIVPGAVLDSVQLSVEELWSSSIHGPWIYLGNSIVELDDILPVLPSHVRNLDLSNNQISHVNVHAFERFPDLHDLSLYGNGFGNLVLGVFNGVPNLFTLRLDSNKMTAIPQGLLQALDQLGLLYLDNSPLMELRSNTFVSIPEVRTISVNNISLSNIDAELFRDAPKLRTLKLASNSLSSLPTGVFDNLANLQELDLQDNRLQSLSSDVFADLSEVWLIDLRKDSLKTLPSDVFRQMSKLGTLHLEDNSLIAIPVDLLHNLTELTRVYLDNNDLTTIEDGTFDNLPNLETVDLTGNALKKISCDTFPPERATPPPYNVKFDCRPELDPLRKCPNFYSPPCIPTSDVRSSRTGHAFWFIVTICMMGFYFP
ncbi:uncharacterized protein LOC144864186 [Branchiostoma floridae x Branchiostoma japonicum]